MGLDAPKTSCNTLPCRTVQLDERGRFDLFSLIFIFFKGYPLQGWEPLIGLGVSIVRVKAIYKWSGYFRTQISQISHGSIFQKNKTRCNLEGAFYPGMGQDALFARIWEIRWRWKTFARTPLFLPLNEFFFTIYTATHKQVTRSAPTRESDDTQSP